MTARAPRPRAVGAVPARPYAVAGVAPGSVSGSAGSSPSRSRSTPSPPPSRSSPGPVPRRRGATRLAVSRGRRAPAGARARPPAGVRAHDRRPALAIVGAAAGPADAGRPGRRRRRGDRRRMVDSRPAFVRRPQWESYAATLPPVGRREPGRDRLPIGDVQPRVALRRLRPRDRPRQLAPAFTTLASVPLRAARAPAGPR